MELLPQDVLLSKMSEIIKRTIPMRDGVIIDWNKRFAKMFKDEMLNPTIDFEQARLVIMNYLNSGGAGDQFSDVERFILDN